MSVCVLAVFICLCMCACVYVCIYVQCRCVHMCVCVNVWFVACTCVIVHDYVLFVRGACIVYLAWNLWYIHVSVCQVCGCVCVSVGVCGCV